MVLPYFSCDGACRGADFAKPMVGDPRHLQRQIQKNRFHNFKLGLSSLPKSFTEVSRQGLQFDCWELGHFRTYTLGHFRTLRNILSRTLWNIHRRKLVTFLCLGANSRSWQLSGWHEPIWASGPNP